MKCALEVYAAKEAAVRHGAGEGGVVVAMRVVGDCSWVLVIALGKFGELIVAAAELGSIPGKRGGYFCGWVSQAWLGVVGGGRKLGGRRTRHVEFYAADAPRMARAAAMATTATSTSTLALGVLL